MALISTPPPEIPRLQIATNDMNMIDSYGIAGAGQEVPLFLDQKTIIADEVASIGDDTHQFYSRHSDASDDVATGEYLPRPEVLGAESASTLGTIGLPHSDMNNTRPTGVA